MATFAVPCGEPVFHIMYILTILEFPLIYFREKDCSPFDIGLVSTTIARLSYTDKFRFIQNIWKADVGYEFPVLWLVRFPWLAYSKYVDGAFCLPRVCFGMESVWKEWFQAG